MDKTKNIKKLLTEVPTEDGSITLFNHKFQENCHSTSGATLETITHYIQGCKVLEIINNQSIAILEVGFGTGNGFLTTIKQIQSSQFSPHNLEFISLELDEENIYWAQNYYPELKNLTPTDFGFELKENFYHLKILIGDARKTIKNISNVFDCIYQDAFSPKKNPSLWTKEWFSDLKNLSHPKTIMSTYSSSISIRKSMLEAGWVLYEGKNFGKKRSSTRATLHGQTSEEIFELLNRSPSLAIYDKDLNQ